jgi:hypothetical protein
MQTVDSEEPQMSTMIVPWYATGFRAEAFEKDLSEIAAVALRYGATSYAVYRSKDDSYRFQQLATFPDHLDWERYWEGPEMTDFRVEHSGWYQVPVLYGPWTLTASGATAGAPGGTSGAAHAGAANGHGDGAPVDLAP